MRSAVLRIVGMHCASCAQRVENRLKSVDGVLKVGVSFTTGEAYVEYDESKVSLKDIVKAVRSTGYDVELSEISFRVRIDDIEDEETIAKELLKIDGVVDVYASHIAGIVRVLFNPLQTDVSTIESVLRRRAEVIRRFEGGEIELEELIESKYFRESTARLLVLWTAAIVAVLFHFGLVSAEPLYSYLIQMAASITAVVAGFRILRSGIAGFLSLSPGLESLISLSVLTAFTYSLYSFIGLFISGEAHTHRAEAFFEVAPTLLAITYTGRLIESRLRSRVRRSVEELLRGMPKRVRVLSGEGEVEADISKVSVGDRVVVRAGEKIPVDGVIVSGEGYVDESHITGESTPRHVKPDEPVYAGSILILGYIVVHATRVGKDTLLSEIVRYAKLAQAAKPPDSAFVDLFSKYFTWVVIAVAAASAVVWSLFGAGVGQAVLFAASVLAVACPCGVALATPMATAVGVAISARIGVLVRDPAVFEKLDKVRVFLFDKTGTLTEGKLEVIEFRSLNDVFKDEDVLRLAAIAEKRSEHPIASAIVRKAAEMGLDLSCEPDFFDSMPGLGVIAKCGEDTIVVGGRRLAEQYIVEGSVPDVQKSGTVVYVALNGRLAGYIVLGDRIRADALAAIRALKLMGYRVGIVSGDKCSHVREVASEVGAEDVYCEALPDEKADIVRKYGNAAFAGDGVNDAVAISASMLGVAVFRGTDIAKEAGDVVLLRDNLNLLVEFISLGKRVRKKVVENVVWAFVWNIALIPVAAGLFYSLGVWLRPEYSALAMMFSDIAVVSNSLTLFRAFNKRAHHGADGA